MAKCDLTIELDDPDRIHLGGETVSGVVRVQLDTDVQCKGLQVKSVWRTHGQGNVDSGDSQTQVLFEGAWKAGENPEYRFELPIADWPPSYHGHYLNVDHYVDARVMIPWGFDPKASASFLMRPSCSAGQAKVVRPVTQLTGVSGAVVGAAILLTLGGFFVALAAFTPIGYMLLPIGLIGGAYWFMRSYLPQYLLGDVQLVFETEQVVPGQTTGGELIIRPRRNVSINAVTLNFQAREQCVSGSGSNRKIHKHIFFEKAQTLQEMTTLSAAGEYRYPFSVTLPEDAPLSIHLRDNELIWICLLRVDIPRWPDWTRELPLKVIPNAESDPRPRLIAAEDTDGHPGSQVASSNTIPEQTSVELTFQETASHLDAVRGNAAQHRALVEAVTGLSFQIAARVERRLLYGGDNDPHVYKDGYAVWAHYPEPKLPMVLYVPHDLADEFEQIGNDLWQGRGTVVGWDSLHQRLQVKIESRV